MFAFHSIFFKSFTVINLKNVTFCKLDQAFHPCRQCRGGDILQEFENIRIYWTDKFGGVCVFVCSLFVVVGDLFCFCNKITTKSNYHCFPFLKKGKHEVDTGTLLPTHMGKHAFFSLRKKQM